MPPEVNPTGVKVASFTDSDPGGKLGEYRSSPSTRVMATWNCCPGATVTQPGGAGDPFVVMANHTAEQGKYATSVGDQGRGGHQQPTRRHPHHQVTITPRLDDLAVSDAA